MFKKSRRKLKLLGNTIESFETIIGSQTRIHGRVELGESVRIDGCVDGDIEGIPGKRISVALGASGKVRGDIHAYRVLVAGLVEGNVYAEEQVELHSGSEVRGDIVYGEIAIEKNAKLNGLMISRTDQNIAAPKSTTST